MLVDRFKQLVANPNSFDAAQVEQELAAATPEQLLAGRAVLAKSASALASNEGYKKLLGLYEARVKTATTSGSLGTYGGALARFEANNYITLKRETANLFPGSMPDFAVLAKQCEEIVSKATANAQLTGARKLSAESVAPMANYLLGINTGPDQISEIIAHKAAPGTISDLEFHAFDAQGFNVIYGAVKAKESSLHINFLKASHGRDVSDLKYTGAEQKMPGRGNARAVAEGLNGAVACALAAGFDSLSCNAGTVDVCELYMKMGFKRVDGKTEPEPQKLLKLDLTNPDVVQQMMFVFSASRMSITDVPKNVDAKIAAAGQPVGLPTRHLQKWPFDATTEKVSFVLEPPKPAQPPELSTTTTEANNG